MSRNTGQHAQAPRGRHERGSLAFVVMGLLAGCMPAGAPPQRLGLEEVIGPEPSEVPEEEPELLSAHVMARQARNYGGSDALALVFSTEVDAASLDAGQFMLLLSDGGIMRASEAMLAPASEADENRTVVLLGDFEDSDVTVDDVVVVDSAYAEDGRKLLGLSAPVRPFERPDEVVLAVAPVTIDDGCSGAARVVRTYWTDVLRGVELEDLGVVEVELSDGRVVHPTAFADHDARYESREDNVLDLCVAQDLAPRWVRIPAGVFDDGAGHSTAAVEQEVTMPPRPVVASR